jgi:hypothetical protein
MENTREYYAPAPEEGQRIVLHHRLVKALGEQHRHGKAASEWAIHRLVERGMLTARYGRSDLPSAMRRDGVWHGGGSYEVRELKYCLVESTARLWEWWRTLEGSHADSSSHAAVPDQTVRSHQERTSDPHAILDTLLAEAESRRKEEDEARRIAQARTARLREQATLRNRLAAAFERACRFTNEEHCEGRKPGEEGFGRWAEQFLALGVVLRECDGAVDGLGLEGRLRAVAGKTAPAAMKYACALLLVAMEGRPDAVKSALGRGNGDRELRRFVLWLPYILDNLWLPFPDDDGRTRVALAPEGASLEEAHQADQAFGWRPLGLSAGQPGEDEGVAESPGLIRPLAPHRLEAESDLPRPAADTPSQLPVPVPAESPSTEVPPTVVRKPKRSTERGEGRVKLIAALTHHHQYADGGCLNVAPVRNNELARQAGVSTSTAKAFFDQAFGGPERERGHAKYMVVCRDPGRLAESLKVLNGEFAPHELYGRKPADEDERDEDA